MFIKENNRAVTLFKRLGQKVPIFFHVPNLVVKKNLVIFHPEQIVFSYF